MTSHGKIIFLALYIIFIVYGSLFPLAEWRPPHQDIWSVWLQGLPERTSRSDLLTNLLVYIPFGFLLSINFPKKSNPMLRLLLVTVLGTALSFIMEYLQMFLPARTSSLNDILLNAVSSCVGGVCAWGLGKQSRMGTKLRTQRQLWFHAGRVTDIGLIILGAWVLMQLAPFVPSLDFGDIKNGLKPIWFTLQDLSRFDLYKTATYSLYIAALGAALILVLMNSRFIFLWYLLFVGTVLLCKITIVGRQLSLEALAGFCGATIVMFILQRLPRQLLPLLGICLIASGFTVDELRPDISFAADFHEFSWVPFGGQMGDNLKGIGSIVEGLWPFAAMAYFFIASGVGKRKALVAFCGGGLAFIVFILECAQRQIPGRYPDMTTVLLAVMGWSLPWLFSPDGMTGVIKD